MLDESSVNEDSTSEPIYDEALVTEEIPNMGDSSLDNDLFEYGCVIGLPSCSNNIAAQNTLSSNNQHESTCTIKRTKSVPELSSNVNDSTTWIDNIWSKPNLNQSKNQLVLEGRKKQLPLQKRKGSWLSSLLSKPKSSSNDLSSQESGIQEDRYHQQPAQILSVFPQRSSVHSNLVDLCFPSGIVQQPVEWNNAAPDETMCFILRLPQSPADNQNRTFYACCLVSEDQRCYCLVSAFPYFDFFFQLLTVVASSSDAELQTWSAFVQAAQSCPRPALGHDVLVPLPASQSLIWSRPLPQNSLSFVSEEKWHVQKWTLPTLFSTLSFDTFMTLVRVLICESHPVVVGICTPRRDVLSCLVLGLEVLLEPLAVVHDLSLPHDGSSSVTTTHPAHVDRKPRNRIVGCVSRGDLERQRFDSSTYVVLEVHDEQSYDLHHDGLCPEENQTFPHEQALAQVYGQYFGSSERANKAVSKVEREDGAWAVATCFRTYLTDRRTSTHATIDY